MNEEKITCIACGALVSVWDYYDGEHNRSDCRANRGLVPCDSAVCLAKNEPKTREEYMTAYEHWRKHSHLSGCSHGC